ncbi:AI-2E family transporter [Thalassoglobus sp. JC818]|uniref:AI-2E family transporter n=1 Tax=Thalassoglobus sp. JC818 TaxID=3232136 RepID=UPI00345847E1
MRDKEFQFSPYGNALIYSGSFVLTIAGLRAASSIIIPFLLAVFLSVLFVPILQYLAKRMPYPLAISTVMVLLISLFGGIPFLVGGSLRRVLRTLPRFQEQLRRQELVLIEQLEKWGIEISEDGLAAAWDPATATLMFRNLLDSVVVTFSSGILVLIMVAFMLTESSWLANKLALIDRRSGKGAEKMGQIIVNVRRYVGIKTLISLATGLSIGFGLHLMEVQNAVVWGFIAFLLNYIPNIGSVLAGIPAVAQVLVENGLGMAVAVAFLYLVVNQILGSIIEPRLQGHGLGLSPLIVFISLLFWGWVFGPVGMLLSTPLTMVVKIALEEFEDTRWIAILLGGKPDRWMVAAETPAEKSSQA